MKSKTVKQGCELCVCVRVCVAATGASCWQEPPCRTVWWSCGLWCTSSCHTSSSPTASSKSGSPTRWLGWSRAARSTTRAWSRDSTRCWGRSCSGGSRWTSRSRCPRSLSMSCAAASPRGSGSSTMTSWLWPRMSPLCCVECCSIE